MDNTNRLSDYFRKSAFYIKISKFVVIILMLVFAITCIISFRHDITIENIQLLSRFITLDGSSSHYSEEFSVSVREDSEIIMLRDNLGVVSNNNISLYDLSGRKLFSYDYSMSSPSVSHDNHYILVYDVGGSEASVFNSFSKIKTFSFEFPIYAADIKNDHVAFICGNDLSRSVLQIYRFDNKEKDYTLSYSKESDKFFNSVSLTDNGKNVLASSVSSSGGKYDCSISVFDTKSNSKTPVLDFSTENELPVLTNVNNNGASYFAITDSSVKFFDKNLTETSTYKFNQSKVSDFYSNEKIIVITERNNLSGNSMKLNILDAAGNIIREFTIPDEISDVAIGNKFIFALGENGVYRYSIDAEDTSADSTYSVDTKYHSVVCDTDDNCYIANFTLVSKVSF